MSSGEEQSQDSTTDKASGDPQTSTTDESTGEPRSQVGTTDEYFGEEKLKVNAMDKASGEPDKASGEPEKALDKPWLEMGTTDQFRDLQSQSATKSFEQEKSWVPITDNASDASTADKSSGESESHMDTTDTSGDFQSQESAAESFQKEALWVPVTDNASDASTADKSSGESESHMDTTDTSGDFQSQESAAESFEKEELSVPVTDNASDASTADKPTDEPELLESNVGNCPIKEVSLMKTTEKQEVEESNADKLRRRQFTHSGGVPKSPAIPGELESQVRTTDKSCKQDPQPNIAIEERSTTIYNWLIGGFTVFLVVGALVYSLHSWTGQPTIHRDPVLEIFFKEVATLKKDFPGQYEGLWFRSEKILKKHLNTSHPSSPSILILTAAQDGEETLHCVSKRLAKSYANSLGASWIMVNGPSKSKYDSDTSKMQIDHELSSGFQSNSRAAVLNRIETLPSGSLLILYKYCDHENAAFKNVALVLTVLLEEPSLQMDLSFTEVEEKVKDLLWERFANSEVSAHNEMDVDKLSGVWSRISHIVLPVLPVGSVESGSCPGVKD